MLPADKWMLNDDRGGFLKWQLSWGWQYDTAQCSFLHSYTVFGNNMFATRQGVRHILTTVAGGLTVVKANAKAIWCLLYCCWYFSLPHIQAARACWRQGWRRGRIRAKAFSCVANVKGAPVISLKRRGKRSFVSVGLQIHYTWRWML